MSEGSTDRRDDLAAEVVRLTEENARLRKLLGLDERADNAHTVSWSPTLLSEAVSTPLIDASSLDDAKLALLMSLFGARSDVHLVDLVEGAS